jgi:hypothetical protein
VYGVTGVNLFFPGRVVVKELQALLVGMALVYGAFVFDGDPLKGIFALLVAIFCMLTAIFMAIVVKAK